MKRHKLDTSRDSWLEPEELGDAVVHDMDGLLEELGSLDRTDLDYLKALRRCVDDPKVGEDARRVVLSVVDGLR